MITPEGADVEVIDDTFDTMVPSELPETGSPVADYLLIAGVILVTGWFLSTVAAARKPEGAGEETR